MNTKQRKKINVIDIILLVTVLAALIIAGMGIARRVSSTGDRLTVRYIMEVNPIENDFISKVSAGNSVFDHTTSGRIGTVKAVSHAKAYYENSESPMEGYSMLYITAEAEAVKTDVGYTIGSTVVSIGRELEMRFPNLYCVGKCVSIEIVK